VEDPAEVLAQPSRDLLHRHLRHQVKADLGTDVVQPLSQRLSTDIQRLVGELVGDPLVHHHAQRGQVVLGSVAEPPSDHAA
jgi:hypothetical protein